jgi:hypothetical protein
MKDDGKAPLDYVQSGLQSVLGSLTMLIYGAFALLVIMVAFGFVYAMVIG